MLCAEIQAYCLNAVCLVVSLHLGGWHKCVFRNWYSRLDCHPACTATLLAACRRQLAEACEENSDNLKKACICSCLSMPFGACSCACL